VSESPVISLRQAGIDLGMDPKVVKGAALAMGVPLYPSATSLLMNRSDFERIKSRLDRVGPAKATAVAG
jgi:hypothetical protein